jgi:hypothetical protein
VLYSIFIIISLIILGIIIFIKPLSNKLSDLSDIKQDLSTKIIEDADGSTTIYIYTPFHIQYLIIPVIILALSFIDLKIFTVITGIKIRLRNKIIFSFTIFLYILILFYPSLSGILLPLTNNNVISFYIIVIVLALFSIAFIVVIINWVIKIIRIIRNGKRSNCT